MTPSLRLAHTLIPDTLSAAIRHVGTRMNAWVALDATLAGVALGGGVAVALRAAHAPLRASVAVGLCIATAVAARELQTRWTNAFSAAAMLDQLLDAKDRFLSALHFALEPTRTDAHDLQLAEVQSFLARSGPLPTPPRPSLRAPRFAAAAVVVLLVGIAVPRASDAFARWNRRNAPFAPLVQGADSPQAIAARAARLREALRDSPGRRIDAEINALERALAAQTARLAAQRTEAIERAAAALDRANEARSAALNATAATPASSEVQAAQHTLLREQQARADVQARLAALQDNLARANARYDRAREANDTRARTEAQRALHSLLDQSTALRLQHEDAMRREAAAARALADARQRPATPTQREPRTPSLNEAVAHLDRAMQATEATERPNDTSTPETTRALQEASQALGRQLPETAQALSDAARASDAHDGQRMNEALERAREQLAREAHAEPAALRRAREAVDALHDQAAAQAAQDRAGNGDEATQREAERRTAQAATHRERESLRNAQSNGASPEDHRGTEGDPSQQNCENQASADNSGAGQTPRSQGMPSQNPNGQTGAQGQQGQPGQSGQQGQQGPEGQQGATGDGSQSGRRDPNAAGGARAPGSGSPSSEAWRSQGMTAAPGAGAGSPNGASMPGHNGAQGQHGTDTRGSNVGGNIGNDHGQSYGTGYSQGNRTAQMGSMGTQTNSNFERGVGETEGGGENRMAGNGPGQARGAEGTSSAAGGGGSGATRTQGGHAWGSGSGDRLTVGNPGTTGPFGRSVDPGGVPARQAQIAPDARGVMMPGLAHQGTPTGPTSEAPVAPGALLPNVAGDGALAGSSGNDPEASMTTQRVPPSLRAYVRRYFQRVEGSGAPHDDAQR